MPGGFSPRPPDVIRLSCIILLKHAVQKSTFLFEYPGCAPDYIWQRLDSIYLRRDLREIAHVFLVYFKQSFVRPGCTTLVPCKLPVGCINYGYSCTFTMQQHPVYVFDVCFCLFDLVSFVCRRKLFFSAV